MSIKLFYNHTKYEVDRSKGLEIIWPTYFIYSLLITTIH